MISFKPGAELAGLRAEILFGLLVVKDVFETYGLDLVVTEATGGNHMQGSLHYRGLAVDIRSRDIPTEQMKKDVLIICKEKLGKNFDMILEVNHYHLEMDPK